jgi:hypothetical protein
MNMFESFSGLCHHLLLEYSTTIDILKNPDGSWHIGAEELIDYLMDHIMNQRMIKHNVQWEPIDPAKITWWGKKVSKGAILVLFERGTALLEGEKNWWSAYISDALQMQRHSKATRYGDMEINFPIETLMKDIGSKLGAPVKSYITDDLGIKSVEKLRKKRKAVLPKRINYEQILMRFKPLWEKTLIQAMADVKGWYSQLIKNDAYAKAEKKMQQLRDLRLMLDHLESSNTNELKKNLLVYLTTAVHMAAAHHYPTPTGNWGEAWSETAGRYVRRYKAPGIVEKFLADIENGDMNKLGSVLGYLKQELVKGH